jgi:uncharacterized protein YkwD
MRTTITLIFTMVCCIALTVVAAGVHAEPATPAAPTKVYLPLLAGTPGVQTPEEQKAAGEVLALINAERARVGCGPLTMDQKLLAAAQGHSRDMATNNFFDHIGSGGSTVADRASAAGYGWGRVGENIAAGQRSAAEVTAGWMGSAGHRDNILDCSYVHTGIGYVYQADDKPLAGVGVPYYRYWTQVFAAPQ